MVTAPGCELVEVAFRGFRREIYANTREIDLARMDTVIVEIDRGEEVARVLTRGEVVSLKAERQGLSVYREILRKWTTEDAQHHLENQQKEAEVQVGLRQVRAAAPVAHVVADGGLIEIAFCAVHLTTVPSFRFEGIASEWVVGYSRLLAALSI
jgi:hypothetical protein